MKLSTLKESLSPLALIAILRGLKPENTEATIRILLEAGIRAVEVPLNSPEPLTSIKTASQIFGDEVLIGAGTVLTIENVNQVKDAGGQFIVSPNADSAVIKRTKSIGMFSLPGVSTPSEAFGALKNGADMLKIFPAEAIEPKVLKAWRAVLPKETWLLPVGGITSTTMAAYIEAGANGFGLGSALYRPTDSLERISSNAEQLAKTFLELTLSHQ